MEQPISTAVTSLEVETKMSKKPDWLKSQTTINILGKTKCCVGDVHCFSLGNEEVLESY